MRRSVLGIVLMLALPLHAQKNLLPAAKAALEKTALQTAQSTLSLAAESALPATAAAGAQRLREVQPAAAPAQPAPALSRYAGIFEKNWNMAQWQELFSVPLEDVMQNAQLVKQIQQLWKGNEAFLNMWQFKNIYQPMRVPSAFSIKNNKIVLQETKNYFAKIKALQQRPDHARKYLDLLPGKSALGALAQKLSKETLIMLGEEHHIPLIQENVGELVLELQQQNPRRRIVLFTEFISLPGQPVSKDVSLSRYYRRVPSHSVQKITESDFDWTEERVRYAPYMFEDLLEEGIEIYPLEDPDLLHQVQKAKGPMQEEEESALSLGLRNKTWARVAEAKMAEIRKTNPDALFIVYAGKAHLLWHMPYALPKFFAKEHPAVVDFNWEVPGDISPLYALWPENDPVFAPRTRTTVHYWTGPEARTLAKQTGFDYLLVAPKGFFEK